MAKQKKDRNIYPLVSLVGLAYNHARFIEDTLMGVLAQDYPNMEIIISDDASPDGTYDVMQKYLQEHPTDKNIRLNCNEKNLGLVPHLNYLMENFVHGDIVVLAGGDDISLPNRVRETVDMFLSDDSIKMVTGQMIRINAEGEEIEQAPPMADGKYYMDDEYIRSLTFMCGSSGVSFRKEIWDSFGSMLTICPTEDSILRFRALLLGAIYVSPSVFTKYRIHENNISRQSNTKNLKTSGLVAQLNHDLLIAQEKHMLSDSTVKRLKKKIAIFKTYRNLGIMKYGKPKMVRALLKIPQLVLQKMITRI